MTKKTKISIILSGLACVGVGLTSYFAVKDSKKHKKMVNDRLIDAIDSCDCKEIIEELKDPDYSLEDFYNSACMTKKEKAIIFGKSYWRTFVAGGLTIGFIIGAQALEIKEIIFLTGALTGIKLKYKDAMNFLRRNYPEQYKEVKKFVNMQSAKRALDDDKYRIEHTYDGRDRIFYPFLDQVLYVKPDDNAKIEGFICAKLATKGICFINEVVEYMIDIGIKDVHPVREDACWELLPFGEEREVTMEDFPILLPDGFEDIYIEESNEELPCKIMNFDEEHQPRKPVGNKYY